MNKKSRIVRFLTAIGTAGALALAGSAGAAALSVNASVSGSTVSVSTTASSLANGSYNAAVSITNSSGQVVSSGSQAFVVGGGGGTMTLTTVDGRTYSSGMSVTNTAPQVCGTYSNPSDVIIGYIAVMSGATSISRYQIIAPSASGSSSFCANIVLDPGVNSVMAAYASASTGQLIIANNSIALTINNSTTNVTTGSVRIQLTWDQVNDMDLHLYAPSASGGTATTTSSSGDNHIWYANKNPTSPTAWGQLDIDKVASNGGYGPENITVTSFPRPGKYLISVYDYSAGSAATTNCVITVYTGTSHTVTSQNFALTRTGQTYNLGYLNVAADGSYTFEALGNFTGDGNGQIIEPPPGYVPPPKN